MGEKSGISKITGHRFFDLYSAVVLAVVIIAFQSSSAEGQTSFFRLALKNYIEETSASLSAIAQSSNIVDINNLAAHDGRTSGQDKEEAVIITPDISLIQQNSIVATGLVSDNYIVPRLSKNQITEYTVQSGDRLSFIASDYGVTLNSIIWANGMKDSDTIQPGQILRIPPVSGVIHKVKNGDTVSSIAKKYGANEAKIIIFNSLSQDGKLKISEEVIVPDGKVANPALAISYYTTKADAQRFSLLPDLGSFFMLPTSGFNWGKIHGRNGVDIANSCGTPIYAAADGQVELAVDSGFNGGFGKFVKIIHSNGAESIYAHASKIEVKEGQNVTKGQVIAMMGTTGRSTGCHLHFEIHGAKNPLVKN